MLPLHPKIPWMKKFILDIFRLDKKPIKGLVAAEWAMVAYLVLTLVVMLFTFTKLSNPESMLWGRLRIVVITAALWAVYRMIPCRFTLLCRILGQFALLSWWYPDTYEINRLFPNLDHVFATWEQQSFECQPSLLFSQCVSNPVFSELMDLGYFCYYPMIGLVAFYFYFCRYKDFGRAVFIILASFFAYYTIYIFLPVTGPQYYFAAIGVDNASAGIFPDLGNYFSTLREALPSPGYSDGLFYQLVSDAHQAGERPTAAFPSSHVGISTILMLLAWSPRNRRMFLFLLPFYVLLCFSTVYIQAHYAVDVFGGLVSALAFYFLFHFAYVYKGWK